MRGAALASSLSLLLLVLNLGQPAEAEAELEPLLSTPGAEPAPEVRHFKASLLARRMLAEWQALGVAR